MDPIPTGNLRTETLTLASTKSYVTWGWISEPNDPGSSLWPASTYQVTLNVVQPNANLQLRAVSIVRVNRYGGPARTGLALIARQAFAQTLGTAGPLVFTLSGPRQVAQPTDRIAVRFTMSNVSTSSQSFGYDAGDDARSNLDIIPH